MYGIAALDNCYCSCEKFFRPDLEGKPIVVLSNNDGCVVARCAEKLRMQNTVATTVGVFHWELADFVYAFISQSTSIPCAWWFACL